MCREVFLAQTVLLLRSPVTALGNASLPKEAFGSIIQCQQDGTQVLGGGEAAGKRERCCLQKRSLQIQTSPRKRHCEEDWGGHQLFPAPAGIVVGYVG